MASGVYKTALGQTVNMDQLRLKNENTKAVGNMNANARGDIVNTNGNIVQGRNQRMHEQYKHKAPVNLNQLKKR
jgi:hypothetical protein